MKYKSIIISILSLLLLSCTGRFEYLNTNPNQVNQEQMQANNYIVGTKVVALQSLVIPVQEHQYQFQESLMGQSVRRIYGLDRRHMAGPL